MRKLNRNRGVWVAAIALQFSLLAPGVAMAKDVVKRDPKGVQGISPFWEAVNRGDRGFVARDFDKAITEYRDAIANEPQNALGHYRLAEAHIAKGNLDEADATLQNALRFSGNNPPLRAKILFVQADVKERRKDYDGAIAKWTEYEELAGKPEAKGFPATAAERKKRLEIWKQMVKDYAEVKERIAKRLAEATK